MAAPHAPAPLPARPALWALAVVALCALATFAPAPGPALGQSSSIEQALESERDRERQARENLVRLTQEERALHGDLAKVEDDLDALKRALRKREDALRALEGELRDARGDRRALDREQQAARRRLGELIRALWPLRVADEHAKSAGDAAWDETDRRFTWGAGLYAAADRALADIKARAGRIDQAVVRTRRLKTEAAQRLAEINTRKDELLGRRLAFARDIRKLRAQRINEEQSLEQILASIEDLDYRLKSTGMRPFAELKGALAPPVAGKRLPPGATSRGTAGRKGMGFSAAEGTPVTAIYWGKVVYDDVLRGFGKVVILSHGDDYYTLYAFLGRCDVARGQEVEKGEPLGTAGYYPAAKGPGLYFELRLGQKAINPVHWLAGQG